MSADATDAVITWTAAALMVLGCVMSLGAAIGLLRFPDLITRMHAATKPQVFGSLLLLTAAGLQWRAWSLVPLLVVAWIFQLLTIPVSAHMVGRAGYRTKHYDRSHLSVDELEEVVARVEYEHGSDNDGAPT